MPVTSAGGHTSGGQVLLQSPVRPADVAVIGILAQNVGEPSAETGHGPHRGGGHLDYRGG
jgi:hypothetical protein